MQGTQQKVFPTMDQSVDLVVQRFGVGLVIKGCWFDSRPTQPSIPPG